METLRTLNKLLKEKGLADNTEVTRFKGKYHLLHICKNGVPVPLVISKDIEEIKNHIMENIMCPECGSTNTSKASKVWRARQKVQRYRCGHCGRLFVPKN